MVDKKKWEQSKTEPVRACEIASVDCNGCYYADLCDRYTETGVQVPVIKDGYVVGYTN